MLYEVITVILALTFFTSAYMSQIVKAGIEGIPKGVITSYSIHYTKLYDDQAEEDDEDHPHGHGDRLLDGEPDDVHGGLSARNNFV